MKVRRALVVVLALGSLAAPRATGAQAPPKPARIGVLYPAPDNPVFRHNFEGFRQALRESGYAEGADLAFDYSVGPESPAEVQARAEDLTRRRIDLLVAIAPAALNAAAKTAAGIPIVAVDLETDPLAAGYVATLARPGGNITGLFLDFPELSGKWLELLKETVARLSRVTVLWDPTTGPAQRRAAEQAARALGLQLHMVEARAPADFGGVFRAAKDRTGALLVLSSPVFNSSRKQIADLAARNRLPAIMPFPGFAEDGGLLAYGPDLQSMFRQAGAIAVKILRGAKPADLPVERPTRFQLAVNLKTARALGLTIPPSVLVRADQVIQ